MVCINKGLHHFLLVPEEEDDSKWTLMVEKWTIEEMVKYVLVCIKKSEVPYGTVPDMVRSNCLLRQR